MQNMITAKAHLGSQRDPEETNKFGGRAAKVHLGSEGDLQQIDNSRMRVSKLRVSGFRVSALRVSEIRAQLGTKGDLNMIT